ncbi:MAG: exosortase/archaeosortase family protein [Phycisphaerales bacterium]|nr:exosortase/archaeosortase family protein [Planctomycetota bacterium]MCH8509469.1 exosortase/archaeosortase family protein [Phycisphaerales bacterium]
MSTVQVQSASAGVPAERSDRIAGLFTRTGLVWTVLLSVAFLGLFYRWLLTQGEMSVAYMQDWGHAFVIPGISGYLIWRRREMIAKEASEVFWPAAVPFVLGVVSYAYCIVNVRNHMLQGASLVLALGGLVLLLTGPRMLRHLFLPIAYLLLAITISEAIMLNVTFSLQLIASQGAWLMLNLIGQPFNWFIVEIDGNMLELIRNSGEVLPMNVAEACSGMRMVVAFYALAGAVALLATREWWQRIALMLLAGPVAILMNMVRVTVLGLLMLIDKDLAAGDAHMIIGTLLLFPSLLLFLGIVWALNRIIGRPEEAGA